MTLNKAGGLDYQAAVCTLAQELVEGGKNYLWFYLCFCLFCMCIYIVKKNGPHNALAQGLAKRGLGA